MNGFKVLEKEYPCNRPVKAFGNGDLGPQNFIYTSDGSIVTLDWEYVGFNDPLAEIMLLHVWPKDDPFLKKYPHDRIYCEMAGIDIKILRWYELYSALEGWIYAVNDQDKTRMCIHEQRARALLYE